MNSLDKKIEKLELSNIIYQVLTDKINIENALKLFPKDTTDLNVKCVFDALVHREADEDLRAKEAGYKETQDEYLEYLAETLSKNKDLPKNVVLRYHKYHNYNLISDDIYDFASFMKKVKRMINF